MGDRGNIAVETREGRIWFYTHWRGDEIPEIVRQALAKKERWDDPGYLPRVIFCTLVDPDFKTPTGYGIYLKPHDNQHPFVVIDVNKQTVTLEADKRPFHDYRINGTVKEIPFDEYIKLEQASWKDFINED